MSVGACRVIGIEGAHGAGKSTLALAVAAECKFRHVNVASLIERARESPFVEDAAVRRVAAFTVNGELHLLGEQIAAEQRLARHHELLVCDKTVANVLGYSRLLLGTSNDVYTRNLLDRLPIFLTAYAGIYDRVFFTADRFDLALTRDPFRPNDEEFRAAAEVAVHQACIDIGLPLDLIPTGLTHDQRVQWVVEKIEGGMLWL